MQIHCTLKPIVKPHSQSIIVSFACFHLGVFIRRQTILIHHKDHNTLVLCVEFYDMFGRVAGSPGDYTYMICFSGGFLGRRRRVARSPGDSMVCLAGRRVAGSPSDCMTCLTGHRVAGSPSCRVAK